jgi:RNA polymerase sigma factor (sigma-70 family)
MADLETHLPAPAPSTGWFATTHWSVILRAKEKDSPLAGDALEQLCQVYWRPLYSYVRRQGYPPADAQDLTQEFFSRLLAKDHLRHLHDQRGKFRSFLLTLLKHFLSDERQKLAAKKRGGGKQIISLDDSAAEELYLTGEAKRFNPDELFERRWAQTLLQQALSRLTREYVLAGKRPLFEALKEIQPGEHGPVSYLELGAQFDLSESAIKSAIHRLRRRHRQILREEIAHTVSCPEEINDEIRYLIALVS